MAILGLFKGQEIQVTLPGVKSFTDEFEDDELYTVMYPIIKLKKTGWVSTLYTRWVDANRSPNQRA